MADREIKWTDAQEAAITASGNNILVSAAAGSGKTTVLVERVIRMLTRKEQPADIDRMLIVTFTRAAAAQMREKIHKAVRAAIEREPDNAHLKRQLMKVHTAQICTIDSLCADIVRENFQDVDIDPGFRTADEAEVMLLKKDVLQNVLEEYYKDPSQEFLDFVEYYMEKNDAKLEEIILTLFEFAESHPEPNAWLDDSISPYQEAGTLFADGAGEWMDVFCQILNREFEDIQNMAETGYRVSQANYGPAVYEAPFMEILEDLKRLAGMPFDFKKNEIERILDEWKRSPTVSKKDEVDEDLKNLAKELRSAIKKKFEKLRDNYFYQDLEEMFRDMAACAPIAETLVTLVKKFSDAFSRIKKEKKIADFSDVAHFALQVLIQYDEYGRIIRDESGQICYTQAADRMAKSFDEIIVDEYQDTNLLQEYLIGAISAERFGRPDVFMVGDVKQSIYGFRMACPELFIRKYDLYDEKRQMHRNGEDHAKRPAGKRIILDENFRSRKGILDITNRVFNKTMIRELGGIAYSEGHELSYGGGYPDGAPEKYKTEIVMIEGAGEKAKLTEAYTIARRIEALVKEGTFCYSDMVILSRTSNNPTLEKVLSERGIPVIKSAKKGFFDSFEIRLILDLLAVIDNPYQDVPMAAVLMSPVCGLTANDLAVLKTKGAQNGSSLYDCMRTLSAEMETIRWFLGKLKDWQQRQRYMEIRDLVEYVIRDSGLLHILAAMPAGENRKANIDFLIDRTQAFADGPYTGLFHFIRYIKQIKEANIDYGQAQVISKEANAVQMMTIHGSKGLEFPVVFLANAGKGKNDTDLNDSIILDRELGIGLELRNVEIRLIRRTMLMETIRQKKAVDSYAEELRLLYVAMTRAKEKLIITGSERYLSKRIDDWKQAAFQKERQLKPYRILAAKSYLTLLGLALSQEYHEDTKIVFASAEQILEERVEEVLINDVQLEDIREMISDDVDISSLEKEAAYIYPFQKATQIQAKISPSQLETDTSKHVAEQEEAYLGNADAGRRFSNNDAKDKSSGMDYEKKLVWQKEGIERGNAYHRFLELFDYSRRDEISGQLKELSASGKLQEGYAEKIDISKIARFLDSDLGKRMAEADRKGLLVREQQFLMGVSMDINHEATVTGVEASSDLPDEEILLVQGIIDAYFEEDGKIILVDYKTDRCTDPEVLVEHYQKQQESYAEALEKLFGRPVNEILLYSFGLDQAVKLR